ncbi:18302_t:CDS:2, partial [Funneliformis geosporum]
LNNDEQVTERLSSKIEEKALVRLWHEEIKCLFLRCRVSPDEAIENLVKKIFNYDLCSNDVEEVICYSKRVLTDFYSKFNKKIAIKVNELKERQSRKRLNIIIPIRTEIENFISQEVI